MSNLKSTPNKSTPNGKSMYSVILLPESPGIASPKRNITGLPRVARDIAADLYNNIQHWNNLHIQGASLIKEIAVLKSDCSTLYPDGLESLITQLVTIIDGLKTITETLLTSSKQLCSLIKLHKSPIPMFISWTVDRMFETAKKIAEAYEQEFRLKRFVVENICHLQDKDKLMFYSACWTHQPYITKDIDFCLESLLVETGHRNK